MKRDTNTLTFYYKEWSLISSKLSNDFTLRNGPCWYMTTTNIRLIARVDIGNSILTFPLLGHLSSRMADIVLFCGMLLKESFCHWGHNILQYFEL